MSTGLAIAAAKGRLAASFSRVAGANSAMRSPRFTQASVAMIAGPPALVTIATRSPAGSGQRSRARAVSNSSSIVSARSTPHWSRKAVTVTSAPASAPVCEEAARAPSSVRPDLTIRIGFFRPIRLAISVKRRGLPNDSRYMQMTFVSGSSSQCSSRSLPLTSALLPIETNWVSPMPSVAATFRIATPSAPDWLTKPIEPGRAWVGEKVASSEISGAVLITPMQLGPIIRTPAARTRALSFISSARPSAPVSP